MPLTLLKTRTRWIEKALGVVTVLAAFAVWHVLNLHERHRIENMVAAAAKNVQADLSTDTKSALREQLYFAKISQVPETTQTEWTAYAQRYMHLHPECVAILWLDSGHHLGWSMAAAAQQEQLHQAVVQQGSQALAEGVANKQPRQTHTFPLASGETVFLTAVPAFAAGEHVGSAVFVNDVRKSFAAMLESTLQMGYHVAVFDGEKEIYRLFGDPGRAEERWNQSAEVAVPGVIWRVRVWPRRETLDRAQSPVPEIMFAVMGALGLALILLVHFYFLACDKSLRLSSEIVERQSTATALRASQERLAGVLDTSADAIISTDKALRITLFNQGAERIFGYRKEEVMGQPLDVLVPPKFRESHRLHMARFAAGPKATMQMGERAGVIGMRKDGAEFPADAAISKLEANGETVLTAILRDVTARVAAEDALRAAHRLLEQRVAERTEELAIANTQLRQLSGHLLQSQEEERRRIARELHDNTAGNLVFIAMTLDNISTSSRNGDIAKHVEECRRWVQQTMEDIRTLSYRMHPPMLDGLGLGAALRWYTAGFSKRSGIAILLKFDPSTPRLSNDMELALFRVVQESLANVHRHSQGHKAEISVTREDGRVQLVVADDGVGIRPDLLRDGAARFGVGIAGMSERIRQLGGQLDVQSSATGTTIAATVPLTEKNSAVKAGDAF